MGEVEDSSELPHIEVKVKCDNKMFQAQGLIDTDSNTTLLPIDLKKHWNIRIKITNEKTYDG